MKKLLTAFCFLLGLASIANAQTIKKKEPAVQTQDAVPKKGVIVNRKADGTPDRRFKANKGLKKDGTLDMRFSRNKKKAA